MSNRFERFERPGDDFPFYNGRPRLITGRQWWLVVTLVMAGFFVLTLPIVSLPGAAAATAYSRAILFFAIPLAGLALVASRDWTALFRPIRARDVLWMVAFAALNFIVTIGVGYYLAGAIGAQRNPVFQRMAGMTGAQLTNFFVQTGLQLFGEEVVTILPFLALMYWLTVALHRSRRAAVVWAWLISAVFFALLHLPSYNWNLLQVLMLIGLARLILTLAYIKTKNIWVSTGAHILNDWTSFALTLLTARLASG